jgi:pSer/pThr/pTyr-binding forkhead associated (FHA) protein
LSTADDLRQLRRKFEAGDLPAMDYRDQRLRLLAAGPSPTNHLVVLEGGPRQTHEVRQCEFQIGADPNAPDNDLVVGLAQVSNRHSVFRFEEDGAWIKDLGSTNGTFVNGQHLKTGAKMLIRPGDQISLSRAFVLVFEGSRDEGASETTTPQGPAAILPTQGSGGFRLLGGVVLEPGEYVVASEAIEPPELLRAAAYLGGLLLILSVVLAPLAIWAWRKHTRGPGYLVRYYLTNRRAIESHQRSYRNIWYEDLVDVFVGTKGNLVAKDRPRFGVPGAVATVHPDSRSLLFGALGTEARGRFELLLREAREQRAPLTGQPADLGPY